MVDHEDEPAPDADARQELEAAEGDAPASGERIAKALARAGVASRREVERYIEAGRVALNGRVLDAPGVRVQPGDILTVDGQLVEPAQATRLFRYNKPTGLLTSNGDPAGRPTVFEALPPGLPRLISVGRLDVATEGLLLLTNDGALARALELPSRGWIRRYRARAYGRVDQARLDRLKDGVIIEGVQYGAIEAVLDKATGADSANLWISVSVAEGKNREVRRVLEHLGLKVNRLIRLAYGPFALSTLIAGEVEEVGPRVIREQLEGIVAPEDMPKGDRAQYQPKRASATQAARRQAAAAAGRRETERGRPERPDKPVYKPGWAKPAKRDTPHAASKPKPKARLGAGHEALPAKPFRAAPARAAPAGEDRPRAPAPVRRREDAPPRSGEKPRVLPRAEAPGRSAERPFKPRSPAENAGRSPRTGSEAPAKPFRSPRASAEGPAKPFRSGSPSGAKFGGKPAFARPAPPRVGGKGAPPPAKGGSVAAAKKTGMELTPTMRRGPRRKGPTRPPRDD